MNLNLFEPITASNLKDLQSGDWIWDNKIISRRKHQRSLHSDERIQEPIGFRLVHILDLKDYPQYSSKPFMLTNIDDGITGYSWVCFEEERFYKLKEKKNESAEESL